MNRVSRQPLPGKPQLIEKTASRKNPSWNLPDSRESIVFVSLRSSSSKFRARVRIFRPNTNHDHEHESIQHILTRHKTDHLVLRRVSDHPQRIQTLLHRFDRFFVETAQKDNAPV